jgi:hypothetical protein
MFPPALAKRLGEAATNSLLPEDSGDRWSAVLEAAAFSPVRALVTPTVAPTTIDDELKKTTLRLGPLLPQIAALLGIEIPAGTKRPKPLRPTSRKEQKKVRDDKRESGPAERGSRDGGGRGKPSGGGRGKPSGPKDRPKGMRDVAEVMAAKRAAEAADAEAKAAAEAAEELATAEAAESAATTAAAAEATAITSSDETAEVALEATTPEASSDEAASGEAEATPEATPEAAPEPADKS